MITPFISMRKARNRRLQAIKERRVRNKHRIPNYTRNTTKSVNRNTIPHYQKSSTSSDTKPVSTVEVMSTQLPPQTDWKEEKDEEDENGRQPEWMRNISELLQQYKSSQLVATQGLSKSSVLPKVPFQERVHPSILPFDEEFINVERYFHMLLRLHNLTIHQILESHFEEHEISLIVPVSDPPEIVQWQKENIINYQRLLQTVFNKKVPTVQLKLAMLYFGLPVAPIKFGKNQAVSPMDVDFLEDKVVHDREPLKFLENYSERCHGDSSRLGKWLVYIRLIQVALWLTIP